ncbi:MAG: hypothetical protein ACLRWH_02880 [Emergencia sp.]
MEVGAAFESGGKTIPKRKYLPEKSSPRQTERRLILSRDTQRADKGV